MRRELNVAIGTVGRTVMAFVLAAAFGLVGAAPAFADPVVPYWEAPDAVATIDPNLITTFGVRDGSAGPDFLGISNTNFDFSGGPISSNAQYQVPPGDLSTVLGEGLAIWATPFNVSPNPYYQNLYYNVINPSSTVTKVTTWMSNPIASWGDSNLAPSYKGNVSSGAATIGGLEFDPDIIFGANKLTGWDNASADGSGSLTAIDTYFTHNPGTNYWNNVWTSNDATNIRGQVYSMGQMATVANGLVTSEGKATRYDSNNPLVSAVSYEKAIRGNLLWIASQIDSGAADKKTVAYLYSIGSNNVGYFFTPTTDNLLVGDDTGAAPTTVTTPDTNYAANNATVDMGYMATLPFITDTYDSGVPVINDPSTLPEGITMGVNDIFKANPACTVQPADPTKPLANVDVIIYNTTTWRGPDLIGTQNGRNNSNIDMNVNYSANYVASWAAANGFGGDYIAGDDFATSLNQGYGTVDTTPAGMSPLLYCPRDYTADKNAKAAWAFARVYPELYSNNPDATYAYWVNNVYHIDLARVPTVVTYMTDKDGSVPVVYTQDTINFLEDKFTVGWQWWEDFGSTDPDWEGFAYYNGSSRASYYSDNPLSEEPLDTIGIFAPSSLWP